MNSEEKKEILIIEDSNAINILLTQFLERLDYKKIHTCENGESGIVKFKELVGAKNIPTVLLDYNLPDMNAFSVITQLLTIHPATKVIIETASEKTEEGIKKTIAYGAHHYLQKPIRFEKLKEIMDVLEAEEQEIETKKLHERLDDLLKSHPRISLERLSQYANADSQEVLPYLEKLESVGTVSRIDEIKEVSCNSCNSVKIAQVFYCPSCNRSNFKQENENAYICNDCGEKFSEPSSELLCLKCNNKFKAENVKWQPSPGFKLN